MTKVHTDRKLFENADFSLEEGEKVGIVGINGTGKSTLLRILAEEDELDYGTYTKGNHVVIRFLPQTPVFPPQVTIYDYVIKANTISNQGWNLEGEAKNILNQLGFQDYSLFVDKLSGGEKKRVALAAALLTSCDILILDEPTNHLDSAMADWLERYLRNRKGALVMVTHDRYFLDQVCTRIVEIDKGKLYAYPGNYQDFLELKAQREEMEMATERKRQSLLRIELEWMKRGARARSTKQKARIERYEELKNAKKPVDSNTVNISSLGSRLGKKTIELHGVSKSIHNRKLFSPFEYIFLRNDRIGIVGHNGCGKSTFLKIITGYVQPDSGFVEIGETVKIGYFSQENEYMDDQLKVIDYIREVGEYIETIDGKITASKMLERFLFDSTMQYQYIAKLSGGEKRRLYLLRILMASPNVLILDEPTNDLDIATLNVLEVYLDEFQGIVITVSHDRYFLDRTVHRIFAFENNNIVQYEGNFTDYQLVSEYDKTKINTIGGIETITSNKVGKTDKVKTKKLKFTYNEEKEFNTIEQCIAEIEQKMEDTEQAMLIYATDFVKLRTLQKEQVELEGELETKLERWMYLQELNEKINSQN